MSEKGGKLRSLLGDSFYAAFGTYATQFFSLLINIVLARKLGGHEYGIYSVLLSTFGVGTMIFSLGAQPVVQRYLPELIAMGNRRGAILLKNLAALTHLTGSLLIALLCWLLREPISGWLNLPEFVGVMPYFLLFTLLKFEAAIFEEMLSAHRSQKFRNLVLATFQALKFSLFWWALPHDGSARTVMLYLVLSNAILLVAFMGRALGLNRSVPADTDEKLPWRRITTFGLLRYSTSITLIGLLPEIDVQFISHFHDPEQAGLYRFATTNVWFLGNLVPMSFLLTVLVPVYVKEWTIKRDKDQLVRVFRFFNKVVNLFLAPALVGSLMLAGPLISEVFDPRFLPAVTAFRIYFLGMYVFWFCNTTSFLLVVLEKPLITLYSRVFVIYNIAMDLILIPRYGIEGAAVATGSAMAFGYIFTYLMVKREIAIRIPWGATFRTFLYSGVMALAIWPLMGRIDGIGSLLLVVAAGALVYGLLAWRLPVFDTEEREQLNGALKRKIFPV